MNPFALPVHPAVVHFPLAMLTAAWVTQLLVRFRARPDLAERARLFETIGVAFLPLTIAAGFIDTRGFGFIAEGRWDLPLLWHAVVATVGSAIFAAHWYWRRRGLSDTADVALSTVGLWFLALAGLIAAEMVYAQ